MKIHTWLPEALYMGSMQGGVEQSVQDTLESRLFEVYEIFQN